MSLNASHTEKYHMVITYKLHDEVWSYPMIGESWIRRENS